MTASGLEEVQCSEISMAQQRHLMRLRKLMTSQEGAVAVEEREPATSQPTKSSALEEVD